MKNWMQLDADNEVVSLDRLDIRFMWRKLYFNQHYNHLYRDTLYEKYLNVLRTMCDNNSTQAECEVGGLLMELKVLDDDPHNWYRNLVLKRTNVRLNVNSLQELCTIQITSNIHRYALKRMHVLHVLWTMFNKLPRLMAICFMAGPAEIRSLYHVKSVFVQYLYGLFFPGAKEYGFARKIDWDMISMNATAYCHACVNACSEEVYRDVDHRDENGDLLFCYPCSMVKACDSHSKLVELTGHLANLQTVNTTPHTDYHTDSYNHYDPNDIELYQKCCPFNGVSEFSADQKPFHIR